MNELLIASRPPSIEFPPNSDRHIVYVHWGFLRDKLKLPDIQREIDTSWVDTLKEQLLKGFQEKGYYALGRLHLCSCQGQLYLLDGQHRYSVLMDLDDPNIALELIIEKVENEQAMNKLFQQINLSRPSIICRNTDTQLVVNQFRKFMTNRYGKFLSTSKRPHRIHIHLDSLVEKIEESRIIERLGITCPNQWIEHIEDLNRFYRYHRYNPELWKEWGFSDADKLLDKVQLKDPEFPLYLGIYIHYEWLERLIKHLEDGIPYSEMVHYPLNKKRRTISKSLRQKVWFKTNERQQGGCYVCQRDIELDTFECGHVKAVFWGGENTLDNLYAICRKCNGDMGTQNLEEYRKARIQKKTKT